MFKKNFAILVVLAIIAWFIHNGTLVSKLSLERSKQLINAAAMVNSNPSIQAVLEPASEKLPNKANSPERSKTIDVDQIRSRARVLLVQGYTAQRAYFAEFNRYTTDLKATGYAPHERELNFKMGFLAEFTPENYNDDENIREEPRRKDLDAFIGNKFEDSNDSFFYTQRAEQINLSEFQKYCRSACTASDNSFEILLAIPLGDSSHFDVWRIDEKNQPELVVDGLREARTNN